MADFFDGLPVTDASSLHGFSGNRIDRRSEKRDDDAVPTALADPSARLYVFHGDNVVLRAGEHPDPTYSLAEAEALGAARAAIILLGWTAAGPRLAVTLPAEAAIDDGAFRRVDLRTLAAEGWLDAADLGALAQARSLCHWHLKHGFCSVCGAASVMRIGGYRRDCPSCGAQHFPRTDPVVIMLAIDVGGGRALLGRQARFAPGMYSCLAGFVEPGETIEDAVRRETEEEASIQVGRVRYLSSQPWPFPSSLMIGCHAEALSFDVERDEAELEACRWFDRDEVRAMIAGTHPDGLRCPPSIAIASHIIRAWAEAD
ncbi:MAG: NAD(+) diphosphatase [Rhizobiales bacterium]|nr:NAD(+) diphosphatase [Hyphomicrobiales bacterium]